MIGTLFVTPGDELGVIANDSKISLWQGPGCHLLQKSFSEENKQAPASSFIRLS